MIRRFITVMTLMFLCVCTGTAKAQLFIEEGKVVLAVSGSDRINKSITVNNTAATESDIKVYWEDFEYKPPYDGTKAFTPAGTSKYSLASWVSFSPQQFKIPPFGKQRIEYSINVPDQIDSGHYGVIFFEQAAPEVSSKAGIKVVSRLGSLFFVEPKDKNKKVVVDGIKIEGNKLTGNINNQGNVILIPRVTYNIISKDSMVVDRGELKKLYIPPDVNAAWSVELPKAIGSGEHTLLLNVDLDEGDAVVKEVQFIKDATGAFKIENVRD